MYAQPAETHPNFNAFVSTIGALRAPDGCPWDRAQTHRSIARNMLEEAYEAVDAIEQEDTAHLREELGDVLLQVVLQSQIAADAGEFTIDDVCAEVNEKMIRRHPHIFGNAQVENADQVNDLWEQVKAQERAAKASAQAPAAGKAAAAPARLLDEVPVGFPALTQAQKISKKAVAAGFEWETLDDVWAKVAEETAELQEAYQAAPHRENGTLDDEADLAAYEAAVLELGDVLFALVNVARKMGIDAESALRASNSKFCRRWACMEDAAAQQGVPLDAAHVDFAALWCAAKQQENA